MHAEFGDLIPEEIAAIQWSFGSMYVDEDPSRAITLLEPMLAGARVPDILSPLGRAYVALGRRAQGEALLREALASWPRHPYAEIDQTVLNAS